MNEVEKMYKLANIKAKEYCDRDSDACMTCCPEWENRQDCWKYKSAMPPFTAEKQLELIKWLAKQPLTIDNVDDEFEFSTGYKLSDFGSFEESLAEIINNLWQDLTEEEHKQIRGILE